MAQFHFGKGSTCPTPIVESSIKKHWNLTAQSLHDVLDGESREHFLPCTQLFEATLSGLEGLLQDSEIGTLPKTNIHPDNGLEECFPLPTVFRVHGIVFQGVRPF